MTKAKLRYSGRRCPKPASKSCLWLLKTCELLFQASLPSFWETNRQAIWRNIKEHSDYAKKYQRQLKATICLLAIQKGLFGRSFQTAAADVHCCSWEMSPAQTVEGGRYCFTSSRAAPQDRMQQGTRVCLGQPNPCLPHQAQIYLQLWFCLWAEQPESKCAFTLLLAFPRGWQHPVLRSDSHQGCHCLRLPRAPQSSGTPINTSGFQHWKAHEQRPWVFMARIATKCTKLTFSENKWKNHSIGICYEFL